jgi:hypothetical protein
MKMAIDGGTPDLIKVNVMPNGGLILLPPFAVAPDGKAVAYNIVENGAGNVWLQPLDGSPGRRLTNFTSDRSFTFQLSPDGKNAGRCAGER